MIGVELKSEMIGKTSEITNLKREELQLIPKLRDWVMLTLQQPVITMEAEILLMETKLVELELIIKMRVNLEETKMNGEKSEKINSAKETNGLMKEVVKEELTQKPEEKEMLTVSLIRIKEVQVMPKEQKEPKTIVFGEEMNGLEATPGKKVNSGDHNKCILNYSLVLVFFSY